MSKSKHKRAQLWRGFVRRIFFPVVYCAVFVLLATSSHVDAFWELFFEREDAPTTISLPLPDDISERRYVRVAVLKDVDAATIQFDAHVMVEMLHTGTALENYMSSGAIAVKPTRSGVVVGSHVYKVYGVRINSQSQKFRLNDREYRGDIVIIRQKNMKLLLVNYIDIDDYLKGVLPKEVSPRWDMEALKAQAVVARTYALFQELNSSARDYSLEKTVASQVYGGATSESDSTSRAVESTRGEIMLYQGNIFPAYFSADCGGHTTRPETVWDTYPNDVMGGVACPYCRSSKHHDWSRTITLQEIEKGLRAKKLYDGDIFSVEGTKMDASGRVTEFVVHGSTGSVAIQGNRFRIAVGPQHLRSTRIRKMRLVGDGYFFEGFGWGHGVGFCQWGSKAMAEAGYTYRQIVRYYFQKAAIIDL